MRIERGSGVLLHVSSLPGDYGIGTMGAEAREFVDFLVRAGLRNWQILPLNPVGEEYSPYKSTSAFAGNPLLISLEELVKDHLLTNNEIEILKTPPTEQVVFEQVSLKKMPLLHLAYERFVTSSEELERLRFQRFCQDAQNWLEDYALYMALREWHIGGSWTDWPAKTRKRDPRTLEDLRNKLAKAIDLQRFLQYKFYRQWWALKYYANLNQVKIFGDIPIFVSFESADTWANQEIFQLDSKHKPFSVAGVPPDYFSETGQLWGNPLYDWDKLRATGFQWWVDRVAWNHLLFDLMRIDHFRGFESYWSVPTGAGDASGGAWVKAPGEALFAAIYSQLGRLPIIAEDLGEITVEVEALRDRFQLPGMRVLQFAFNGKRGNVHLPHNYPINSVAYTGTHDNDTSLGWFKNATKAEQRRAIKYLKTNIKKVHWDFIQAVWSSSASLAIAPMQDLLGLGSESRMNTPGTEEGNWRWKLKNFDQFAPLATKLTLLLDQYER